MHTPWHDQHDLGPMAAFTKLQKFSLDVEVSFGPAFQRPITKSPQKLDSGRDDQIRNNDELCEVEDRCSLV